MSVVLNRYLHTCRQVFLCLSAGFLIAVLAAGSAQAAPPTLPANRAGAIERGPDRMPEKASITKDVPVVDEGVVKEDEGELNLPTGMQFPLNGFEFSGNTEFSDEELLKVVNSFVGTSVTIIDLDRACSLITKRYQKRGAFLARAYLPEQKVEDGIVRIAIQEGSLGSVLVEGAVYYKDYFVEKYFDALKDKPLNTKGIIRTMLLLNELPDLQARAVLNKGEKPATTDIVVKVEDKRPFHIDLDYNNAGAKLVSKHRFGATLRGSNFATQGDDIYIKGVAGENINKFSYTDFGYAMPLGANGTKLGLTYTYSNFNIGENFTVLDIEGDTHIGTLYLTHALARSRATNSDVTLSFDYKDIKNEMLDTVTSHDELRVLRLLFNVDHIDIWKGRNYYSMDVSYGIPDFLGSLAAVDEDCSRQGGGGEFFKLKFGYRRVQQLPWSIFAIAKVSMQFTPDMLPSSEQFVVGGVDSVRGYQQSAYLGDEGVLAGLELRIPPHFLADYTFPFTDKTWKDVMQFKAFIDYGEVSIKNPAQGQSQSTDISGAGFGVLFFLPHDFNISCDVGFALNHKDDPDVADSTVYLQVFKRFL